MYVADYTIHLILNCHTCDFVYIQYCSAMFYLACMQMQAKSLAQVLTAQRR